MSREYSSSKMQESRETARAIDPPFGLRNSLLVSLFSTSRREGDCQVVDLGKKSQRLTTGKTQMCFQDN